MTTTSRITFRDLSTTTGRCQTLWYVALAFHFWRFLSNEQGSGLSNRARQTEDVLKRGSDSLLEAKLKDQFSKPRSLTNRAQSLDLTMSLTRISEASSRLSRPESPENSILETGGSSPTSATAPSFPSVYASPVGSRSQPGSAHNTIGRSGFVVDDEAVEEVSRVISNLGL